MFEIIKMSLSKGQGNIKAWFSFSYNGLVVKSATLFLNKEGNLTVGMPQNKGNDNKYYSICYFEKENISKQEELQEIAISKYNGLLSEG